MLKCYVYTENGTFWFCNQYPKCQFECSEEADYLYERAIHVFLAVNHVHYLSVAYLKTRTIFKIFSSGLIPSQYKTPTTGLIPPRYDTP